MFSEKRPAAVFYFIIRKFNGKVVARRGEQEGLINEFIYRFEEF